MCNLLLLVATFIATSAVSSPAHNRNSHPRGTHYSLKPHNGGEPFVEVSNTTWHGFGPREEARAACSVRTHEVNATANATITRRLHGVVTTREFQKAIQRLELIIFGQMQQLWQSLDALRGQLNGDPRSVFPDRRSVFLRYHPEAG